MNSLLTSSAGDVDTGELLVVSETREEGVVEVRSGHVVVATDSVVDVSCDESINGCSTGEATEGTYSHIRGA